MDITVRIIRSNIHDYNNNGYKLDDECVLIVDYPFTSRMVTIIDCNSIPAAIAGISHGSEQEYVPVAITWINDERVFDADARRNLTGKYGDLLVS